jgi:monothiol glutaredoxin
VLGSGITPPAALTADTPMRDTFPEAKVHSAIQEKIATYRQAQVAEVKALIAAHRVVVIGMSQNPYPKKARRLLDAKGIAYEYLGIGSYMSQWKPRLALKMWTGWPTFPMIFVDGVLIGGFQDLERLDASGELGRILNGPRGG